MRLTRIFLIFICIFISGACRRPQSQQAKPEITSHAAESEEGYHDLVFLIQEHRTLADGSQLISAAGTHKGKPVGLQIALSPSWKQGSIDLGGGSSLATYRGDVTFRSVGAESDLLLQIMDHLYGTKLSPKKMKNETIFTAISLEGNPQSLKNGMTKIKLFFETDKEDEEAELFANIDVNTNKVYINEKDAEYRSAVINALKLP